MNKDYIINFTFETLQQAQNYLDNNYRQDFLFIKIKGSNILYYADNATNEIKEVISEKSESGGNTIAFYNSLTNPITTNDIGLLAMQTETILNFPPSTIDDILETAEVCNTKPTEEGLKGEYIIGFDGIIITKPETKLIRVVFNNQPNLYDQLNFLDENGGAMFAFGFIPNDIDGIHIGADLATTIENIVTYFTDNAIDAATVDSSDATSITFSMLNVQTDSIRFMTESSIICATENIDQNPPVVNYGSSNLTLFDSFGNTAIITHNGIDNGDGYYPIITINGNNIDNPALNQPEAGECFYIKADTNEFIITQTFGNTYLTVDFKRDSLGSLLIHDSMNGYTSIPNIFPIWIQPSVTYTITTERALDVNAANTAQSIYNNNTNYLLNASSWDSNNSNKALITYASLFRSDSGQPNGTSGAFGLQYFENDNEAIDAISWALNNTNDGNNQNWFTQMFDVETPLGLNIDNNRYEMTISNKTAPTSNGNIWFNTSNNNGINSYSSIEIPAQSGILEHIPNVVLGRICGIDGDKVLIDKSNIFELLQCSEEDGGQHILPYSELFGNEGVYMAAWRGGKVIPLQSYFSITNNSEYTLSQILNSSSLFILKSKSKPNGTALVSPISNIFIH